MIYEHLCTPTLHFCFMIWNETVKTFLIFFFGDFSTDSKVTPEDIKATNHETETSVQTVLATPICCPPTSVTLAKQVNKAKCLIRDTSRKGNCRSKEATLNSEREPGREQTFVPKPRHSPGTRETATSHVQDRYGMRGFVFGCFYKCNTIKIVSVSVKI